MPDHRRFAAGDLLYGDSKVAVAVGAGEDDDSAVHASSSRSIRKFSITMFASNLRHMSSICASGVPSARSSSINFPARTSLTLPKPSPSRAWWIALPWGSRTPFLRVMKTRAFMTLLTPIPAYRPYGHGPTEGQVSLSVYRVGG